VEAAGEEVYFLTYCPIFLLFQTHPATFNLSLLSLSATQFPSYTRILNFFARPFHRLPSISPKFHNFKGTMSWVEYLIWRPVEIKQYFLFELWWFLNYFCNFVVGKRKAIY
jgi:hypothetical protein